MCSVFLQVRARGCTRRGENEFGFKLGAFSCLTARANFALGVRSLGIEKVKGGVNRDFEGFTVIFKLQNY